MNAGESDAADPDAVHGDAEDTPPPSDGETACVSTSDSDVDGSSDSDPLPPVDLVPDVHIGILIANARYIYRATCPDTHPIGRIFSFGSRVVFECYRHRRERDSRGRRCRWLCSPEHHGGRPTNHEGAVWVAEGLATESPDDHMALIPGDLSLDD